mgnify:CR=1 FL=1
MQIEQRAQIAQLQRRVERTTREGQSRCDQLAHEHQQQMSRLDERIRVFIGKKDAQAGQVKARLHAKEQELAAVKEVLQRQQSVLDSI